MKNILALSFLFFITLCTAQERSVITGNITVPAGDDPEGITVINTTSGQGTASTAEGNFRIPVKVNDTLRFSAVQFQEFSVVINQGVVDSGQLNVVVSESVTALPEVVVTPYDVTGYVEVDVRRIPAEDVPLPDVTAAEIEDTEWDFRPDAQTSPENAAMREEAIFSGRARRFGNLFRHIFTSRSSSSVNRRTSSEGDKRILPDIDEQIQLLYDDEFFTEHLNIQRDNIYEFIFFAEDNGLTPEMLWEENELDLIKFLVEQSDRFKEVKRAE